VASVPPQGGRKHPHQEFIQIDTTNILFITGGSFDGVDKIIMNRIGKKGLGFGAEIKTPQNRMRIGETLAKIMPEDLLRFGMIPEFVGRVPIIVTLDALDEGALVRILTEPKNALTKQYIKFFELDSVDLEFTDDALKTIASEALKRNTGARGLRAILEDIMLDVMYELPSRNDVAKCVVNAEVVTKQKEPILVPGSPKKAAEAGGKPKEETA